MHKDERQVVRRAAVTAVGVAVGLTAMTLVGVAVASMVGSPDVPARVGAGYASPAGLPSCGTVGELAAPPGAAAEVPAVAPPGASVPLTLTSSTGEPPRPLAVVVVRGGDVVGGYPAPAPDGSVGVVLAVCGAAATGAAPAGAAPTAMASRPPLPPGDYELVVLFGSELPRGVPPTYAGPALTALRVPLTVARPAPADGGGQR
ncbi:MAG: hypothetical protein ACFCVF_14115 [Kineosporiaceae bacterium]